MGLGIGEKIGSEQEQQLRMQENSAAKLRVSMPGIIQDFDPVMQTATVQPAIRESVFNGIEYVAMEIPLLLDVPVVFPKAGGFAVTFPVKKGDECLIVFADMCIDAWWQSGGVQNQLETRRHDLSDGFAIVGVSSVPNAITGYSANSLQIRDVDGDTVIDLSNVGITISSKQNINLVSEQNVTIKGKTVTTIQTG